VRAREVAALASKQVRPEIKKLRDFLETGNSTLFLSTREVGVIVEELNALKDKNERAVKMLRRHAKSALELAGEES
jgi:transcriptional antiterminator